MKCELSDSLLHRYFDGELSASQAAEFERHLVDCADCGAELVDLDLIRDRLHLAPLYKPAPASLRREIRADLGLMTPIPGVSAPLLWHWLAATATLVFVAIVLWKLSPGLGKNDYQVELNEIVDAHLRSLQPGHLTGVVSSDEHIVEGWFESTLKFGVPVRDFANEGFALQGGRVDAVEGRPLASLVYERDGHLINVFIWPTQEPDSSPRTGSRQGYQWIEWRRDKTEFCAVSDASLADLKRLQGLIADSLRSGMLVPDRCQETWRRQGFDLSALSAAWFRSQRVLGGFFLRGSTPLMPDESVSRNFIFDHSRSDLDWNTKF